MCTQCSVRIFNSNFNIVVLSPVQVGQGAVVVRINVQDMTLSIPPFVIDQNIHPLNTAFYYIGQQDTTVFLAGRGHDNDGVEKSVVLTISKNDLKIIRAYTIDTGNIIFIFVFKIYFSCSSSTILFLS
jgi:hypothetical protein